MTYAKGNIIMDKGACSMAGISGDNIKDVYIASIDVGGVLTNSKADGNGIPTFYAARFVARVEFNEPLPRAPMAPPMMIPRGGGLAS